MGTLDDYNQPRALRTSAVHDLVDAGSNPIWKSAINDVASRSVVDTLTSTMPFMKENAISRFSQIMSTVPPIDTSGIEGILSAFNPLGEQLSHIKSLSSNFLTHMESPYERLMNFKPVGLQASELVGATDIVQEALKVSTSGLGVTNMAHVTSFVESMSSVIPKIDTNALGIEKWAGLGFGTEMVGANYAVSTGLRDAVNSVLESAEEFDLEYGGTEVEERANEFLDSHADIAAQIHSSEILVTLTIRQRKILAGYLSFVLYLSFVSFTIYGYDNHPGLFQILALFGITAGPYPVVVGTYKYSKKVLDKYLTAPEDPV